MDYKLFNSEILETGMGLIIILSPAPETILPTGGNIQMNKEGNIVLLSNYGLNPLFQRISTGWLNLLFHSYD